MSGLLNDPVLLLGLMAFGALLLALPLAFWNLSGEPRSSTSRVVQLLVVAANLLLTAQLLWRWLDSGHFPISNLYESLCFKSPVINIPGLGHPSWDQRLDCFNRNAPPPRPINTGLQAETKGNRVPFTPRELKTNISR